jgi:hypothetical protein
MKAFGRGPQPRDGVGDEPLDGILHPDDLGYLRDPTTYGTIPEQTSLYELAGLQVTEPEEIIEEPIQYGIPVPLRPVEAATELKGLPEDAKAIYRQVIDQLPKSENLIQDYVRLTEFTFELRQAVRDNTITPRQARQVLQPELADLIVDALPDDRYREKDRRAAEVVDRLAEEIERNLQLIASLPPDPPSFGDIQAFYEKGIVNTETFQQLYRRFGSLESMFGNYVREACIDKGPDEIAVQNALGRISDAEARFQLGLIGFDGSQAAEILSGTDPEAVITREQQRATTAEELGVGLADEIGDGRSAQLAVAGIDSLQDLVNSSVEELTRVSSLSDVEARQAIASAEALLERAAAQQ